MGDTVKKWVDLHLHLDGSLEPALVRDLAKEQGIELPYGDMEKIRRILTVDESCESLNAYLRCFEMPIRVLQNSEALFRAAQELGSRLAYEGLAYAEVRFAPQLHTKQGLTQRQAVQSVWQGLRAAIEGAPGFTAQLILCCMRGEGDKENWETIKTARHFLGAGVCAVDLAGAEALYPTFLYKDLFSYARSLEIPFTIHAGEADGPQSVWDALAFGAARIGHGVRAAEDPVLLKELAARKTPLELCYTSNLQTKAVDCPENFPLRKFLRQGIKVTVNTDNMTVSNVTLSQEFIKLRQLGLTEEEEAVIRSNGVEAAFLPQGQKK